MAYVDKLVAFVIAKDRRRLDRPPKSDVMFRYRVRDFTKDSLQTHRNCLYAYKTELAFKACAHVIQANALM